MWREKKVPEDFGRGIIVPILKKGDRKDCKNYRGITLIPHTAKILERILDNRIRKMVEENLVEEQYGFRRGRSTFDPIFTIRQMMEKRWEHEKEMVITFLDLEKAYDSVPRQLVWEVVKEREISGGLIQMIKALYEQCSSCVKTKLGMTEWFSIETGLRQGSVLSPILFIIVMDEIQRRVREKLGSIMMKTMLFADDIVIWGDNEKEVQEQVSAWNQGIEDFGMKVNVAKSKTIIMKRGNRDGRGLVKIHDEPMEVVESFKYLGSIITQEGKIDKEIDERIRQAGVFYQSVRDIVWSKEVPIKCKETLYKSYYEPILTYAAGTWTMTERDKSRIQAAEMKFCRSLLGKTKMDRIRNEGIRNEIRVVDVQSKIETSRLRWFGHMMRMEEERIPKRAFKEKLIEKRPRGRPRKRWKDAVMENIKNRGVNANEIVREEWWRDREKWRSLTHYPTQRESGSGK